MPDRSPSQQLVGALADFLEWARDTLLDDQARRAIVGDLGGNTAAVPPAPVFPGDRLDSVKRYRDAADPDLEAFFSAIQDVRALIEVIGGFAAAVSLGLGATIHETLRAVLDLLATNYARLRYPRWYFLTQVLSFTDETTSVYGDGTTSYGRFGRGLLAILEFIFGPVQAWTSARLVTDADATSLSERTLQGLIAVPLVVTDIASDLALPEVLYGWDRVPGVPLPDAPRLVERTLSRMLSLRLQRPLHATPPAAQSVGATVSLAWVPQAHGGPGFFVALGGEYEADVPLRKPWAFVFEMSGAGGLGLLAAWPAGNKRLEIQAPSEASDFRAAIGLEARPDALTAHSYELHLVLGTGVQLGRLRFEATLNSKAATLQASVRNSALTLSQDALDGFLGRLLPPEGVRIPFDFAAGIASDRGAFLEGQVPVLGKVGTGGGSRERPGVASRDAPVPPPLPRLPNPAPDAPGLALRIPIGRSLGPVTIHELRFDLLREGPPENRRHAVELSTSVSAKIGPMVARVDRVGLQLAVSVPDDPARANLGLFDLDLGVRTPDGVGIAVDAKGVISGGGFLFHDRTQKIYAGALQLTLQDRYTLKAFGLLATRMPDGSKGYSLIVFITADDFRPYPLGMGFTLRGVGGMLAINRRFDEVATREGLKNDALGKLLFPKDLIRNAPEIIRNLATIFPAQDGTHLFGLLATIAWPTPMLVLMELALMYEFNERGRLIVLGRISSLLPSQTNDLLRLKMDALGIIDFNEGTTEIDAHLVDSRLARKFVLTGAMALRMRLRGTGAGFAMAVGGFNPRFTPPLPMPTLDRVTINLASGDNPRITCEAYIAVTPNTVQFGARAHLYAAAYGFSVDGDVGFDVLVRLLPFHFFADFHASIQLKRGTRNLFKVSVEGELEGPLPLRVSAKATFEILWCDFSIRFDKTLVGGARPPLPPAIDALLELRRALGSQDSWTAIAPLGRVHGVTLRKASGGELALDPLGDLTVRQSVAPLNAARGIDTFGGAPVAGARQFVITEVRLNDQPQGTAPVKDLFAPAQFFEMSDDEKLSSPSFAEMDSGVRVGSDAVAFDDTQRVDSPLQYESFVIDTESGVTTPQPDYVLPAHRAAEQVRFGAVAGSALRTSGAARFRDEVVSVAVTVKPLQLVVASTADLRVLPSSQGWIEALATVASLNRKSGDTAWQLVPAHELAG
jgi:hypothetical protein